MKLGSEIIWLSEGDVAGLLTMEETIPIMENAFSLHGKNQVQMPVKVYLDFDPFGGDLRAMPAYLKGEKPAAGVKIVNSNPANPTKNLPAVSGVMILNDPQSGLPLGVFAAGNLTSMRTGAAGGVAAKYLARPSSHVVGLIGCGRQAHTQIMALRELFPIETVLVWGPTPTEIQRFVREARKKFPQKFVSCSSVEEACHSDIVVTTTPVRTPLVKSKWIQPGTHINAIGADAPGKQELDSEILSHARIVVDAWEQASHAGEINVAVAEGWITRSQIAGQLGEVVAGLKPGRTSPSEITVFDSTGLALQDVSLSQYLYDKAIKLKKGKVLKFNG